jgi:hypothetical protein
LNQLVFTAGRQLVVRDLEAMGGKDMFKEDDLDDEMQESFKQNSFLPMQNEKTHKITCIKTQAYDEDSVMAVAQVSLDDPSRIMIQFLNADV